MASAWDLFKMMILVQLFYAFAITLLAHALPAASLVYIEPFSDLAQEISLESVTTDIEDTIGEQVNIPVIELGALVFYSGNILIDLMLNFFFAIPEMIGLLIHGFMMLFNVENYLFAQVQLVSMAVLSVLYFIGVVQLLMNIRSRGSVI